MRRESKGERERESWLRHKICHRRGRWRRRSFLGRPNERTDGRGRSVGRSGMRPKTEGRKKVQPRFAHENEKESAGKEGEKE